MQQIIKNIQEKHKIGDSASYEFAKLIQDRTIKQILDNRFVMGLKLLRQYYESEDLHQLMTIFLWQTILKIDSDQEDIVIYKIISISLKHKIHDLTDFCRREKRIQPENILYIDDSIIDKINSSKSPREDLIAKLCNELATLTQFEKKVVYLRYGREMLIEDLEIQFNKTRAQIKLILKRGIEKMQQELKNKYGKNYKEIVFIELNGELDNEERTSNLHTAIIKEKTR